MISASPVPPLAMDGPLILAIGVACLFSFFLFWMFCRKIVRLGFFVLALTIGATLASGTMYILNGSVDPVPVAIAAISFAWLWTTIRAKVARYVTMAALIVFASVAGEVDWLDTLNPPASAQKTTQVEPEEPGPSRTKPSQP